MTGFFLFTVNALLSQDIFQFMLSGEKNYLGGRFFQLYDGNYLATLVKQGDDFNDRDIIINSIDSNGEILWSKLYGTSYRDCIRNFAVDQEGNLIFIAWTWTGQDDWTIFKIDLQGNLQDYVTIGAGGDDELHYIETIGDNQFVLAGSTGSYGPGAMSDLFFASMDGDLNFNWFKSLGTARKEYSRMARYCSNGTLLAIATRFDSNNTNSDICLIRMTMDGEVLWAYDYNGGGEEVIWGIVETPDGGFITSGYSNSDGAGNYDIHLARFDENGEFVWSKLFGGPDDDRGYEIIQSNGNYFIGGFSKSFNEGDSDLILLEVNEEGGLENAYLFGGDGEDSGSPANKASNGNLLLSGSTTSYGLTDHSGLFIIADETGLSCCSRTPENITVTDLTMSRTPVEFLEATDYSFKNISFTSSDIAPEISFVCHENVQILGPDTVCPYQQDVQYFLSPSLDITVDWIIPESWTLAANQNDTSVILHVTDSPGYIYLVNPNCDNDTLDSRYVTIFDMDPPELGNDTTVCDNELFILDAGTGYASYLWQDSTTTQSFGATEAGQYWVFVTDANGCQASDSILLELFPAPVVDLGNDTAVCHGDAILLDAGFDFESYLWQNGSVNQVMYVNQTGSYWVEVTDDKGCLGYDTINLQFVRPDPNIGNDTMICTGGSVTYTAEAGFAGYAWQNGSGSMSFTALDSCIVWCEVTNSMGCVGRDSALVELLLPPSVSLGKDTSFCAGDSITLFASSPDSISSISWMDGSTGPDLKVFEQGSYWVMVDNACGSDTDSIVVTMHQLPVVNLGNDTLIAVNTSIELTAGTGLEGYSWSDGSAWPTLSVSQPGSFWVNVFDGHCYNSDTIHIEPIGCDLFIPNVFTPNGDGPNDHFFADASADITDFILTVYNRWGEKVWGSDDIHEKWDGMRKGAKAAEGTYFWVLTYYCKGSPYRIERKGTVTLLR